MSVYLPDRLYIIIAPILNAILSPSKCCSYEKESRKSKWILRHHGRHSHRFCHGRGDWRGNQCHERSWRHPSAIGKPWREGKHQKSQGAVTPWHRNKDIAIVTFVMVLITPGWAWRWTKAEEPRQQQSDEVCIQHPSCADSRGQLRSPQGKGQARRTYITHIYKLDFEDNKIRSILFLQLEALPAE